MEKPRPQEDPPPEPKLRGNNTLSPSTSQRRTNNLNSPEFEFWMVRNPSFPQPNLHSADELFVDGIILPLCLLSDHPQPPKLEILISDPDPEPEREPDVHEPSLEPGPGPGPGPEPEPSSSSSSSSSVVSTSKRWRDIFKVGDKKNTQKNTAIVQEEKRGEKLEKKKDRKNGTNNTAELNINIWPFSRSRSAGNSGNRPKMAPTRKVSSAPCSRSNSGGESKSKKWPTSPNRGGGGGGGIHLGRNSPVWQVRRNGGLRSSEPVARNVDKDVKKDGSDTRGSKSRLGMGSTAGSSGGGGGLNLNVQMCMGYRQNSSCRSDENQRLVGGGGGGGEQRCSGGATVNGGGNGVKMFNLRTLFSKKVY